MDELLDILDSEGNFTGIRKLKSHAHSLGLFHATVHIWLYTMNGEILLQQRGKNKNTFPLFWDVSVAGHVEAGEEIESSALREVQEEIGLIISKKDLEKIGVFKSIQRHSHDFMDCEFHYTFLCELKVSLQELKKQENEIETLDLISLVKFSEEILRIGNTKKYVPHEAWYYSTIIKAIKERL